MVEPLQLDPDLFMRNTDPFDPRFYEQLRTMALIVNSLRTSYGPDFIVSQGIGGTSVTEVTQHTNFWFFAVNLTEDGGSDGDKTTQASFTYTVKNLYDNHTYGTAMTPEETTARGNIGSVRSGDGLVGSGYLKKDGAFALWNPNEEPIRAPC